MVCYIMNMRISLSGSKGQYEGDTRNRGICRVFLLFIVYFFYVAFGPLEYLALNIHDLLILK